MHNAEIIDFKVKTGAAEMLSGGLDCCFHCGEALPAGLALSSEINGEKQLMCCLGCKAVADTIVQYGLGDYYRFREKSAHRAEQLLPEELQGLETYDNLIEQEEFVPEESGSCKTASFLIADMTCPACVWLIETRLRQTDGIRKVEINFSTHRASISWIPDKIKVSGILKSISRLGYKARPFEPSEAGKQLGEEQNEQLRRLGVAGVLGVQVMMLSIALYVGDWSGIEENYRIYFSCLSWILTTPVMLYSSRPFFVRAWRDISMLRTGMDVPVALGLLIAYVSSSWATATNSGQIYYDSIVMFIFFLLCGRYLEFRARRQSALVMESVGQSLPVVATRKVGKGNQQELETVPVESLRVGDIVLVRSGDVVPADGTVLEGETSVDEALLTGESRAVPKKSGDFLIGGSSNVEQSIYMLVSKTGSDTVSSHIYRLMELGQQQKPALLALSNRVSAFFVLFVLILATITAIYWMMHNPSIWVSVTIATLVVTCPCALSLATPLALAAASTTLMEKGLILVDSSALEVLNKVDKIAFDKTGTLTNGKLKIVRIEVLSALSNESCLSIAGAIEINSLHPIAKAFQTTVSSNNTLFAGNVCHFPGSGVSGIVQGREWYLGNRKFIKEKTGFVLSNEDNNPGDDGTLSRIIMADQERIHCYFYLGDSIRDGAQETIDFLNVNGVENMILSGDALAQTRVVSETIGITEFHAEQSPADKMSKINGLQDTGMVVAMAGDGANDAPVLASADVSIAMGEGAALANTNAQVILLKGRLDKLITLFKTAKATHSIIKQNMIWAIAYNITALPLAVTGTIEPWMAAIGMSVSSLLVVINSSRLRDKG